MKIFLRDIYAPAAAVLIAAITMPMTTYIAIIVVAIGAVRLRYTTPRPIARLTSHQMKTRSIEPSSRAGNELSSRNGANTARFVVDASVWRAYASGVLNSDSAARITPECTTTAKT